MHRRAACILSAFALLALASAATADTCVECHTARHPGIVADWKASRHAVAGVSYEACRGSDHNAAADAAKAGVPTPEVCATCHAAQVTDRPLNRRPWGAVVHRHADEVGDLGRRLLGRADAPGPAIYLVPLSVR